MLLYAGTHIPRIAWASGLLLVNGGRPTIPNDRPQGSLGTVAIVEVTDGIASARIVELAKTPAVA